VCVVSARHIHAWCCIFALPILLPLTAIAQEKPEQAVEKSAEQWLALVDAGKYGESWEQAAAFFKSAVTKGSCRKWNAISAHSGGRYRELLSPRVHALRVRAIV